MSVPDSPAGLHSRFSTAAVVGAAGAEWARLLDADPATWLFWNGLEASDWGVNVTTTELIPGIGWVTGPHDPRVRVSTKLATKRPGQQPDKEILAAGIAGLGHGFRESVTWLAEISPGSVRFLRKDYNRAEKAAQRALEVEWLQRDIRHAEVPLQGPTCERCGHTTCRVIRKDPRRVRGTVSSWSSKSRTNMSRTLNSLDYQPLVDQGPLVPVTLTYPGDWLTVAPSSAAVQGHLRKFRKRYARAWGSELTGPWKREFQDRIPNCWECRRGEHVHPDSGRAPHFHILTVVPAGRTWQQVRPRPRVQIERPRTKARKPGTNQWQPLIGPMPCVERKFIGPLTVDYFKQVGFQEWISHEWADVVHHPDPEERRKHIAAGTQVKMKDAGRYADPRRVGAYFSKHGSFGAKDYQNTPPPEWVDPIEGPVCVHDCDHESCAQIDSVEGVGRYWGVWGLSKAVTRVPVSEEVATRSWRTLRRYKKAVQLRDRATGKPAVHRVEVPRVSHSYDPDTGEITRTNVQWRGQNRRIKVRLGGRAGFLAVNDGPGVALTLARYASMVSLAAISAPTETPALGPPRQGRELRRFGLSPTRLP